ncbi:MAG TPA: copper homeostasis periplasmic binding protein CopC [Alphaproteobacteria bacterium]|nr:copper homeostasis periplasmic binding protein CopC [Alphaproteobacteria bacterium]
MRLAWLAASTVVALAAGPAGAHAFLDHADPAVGAQIPGSPKVVRLWFTERVEPKFSKVAVTTASGVPVKTGPIALSPSDASELDLPLAGPLAPGSYKVSWQVVSTDTHRTQGDFTFEVGR